MTQVFVSGQSELNRDVTLIHQAIAMFVHGQRCTYLSGPISTGKRYFDALANHQVRDRTELDQLLGEGWYWSHVRQPNVADGISLAHELTSSGVPRLLNTGPLFIESWRDSDYMAFCLDLLRTSVDEVYLHPGWCYSSGAVEEYAFCCNQRVPVLDHEGKIVSRDAAMDAVQSAISDLKKRSLPSGRIERALDHML